MSPTRNTSDTSSSSLKPNSVTTSPTTETTSDATTSATEAVSDITTLSIETSSDTPTTETTSHTTNTTNDTAFSTTETAIGTTTPPTESTRNTTAPTTEKTSHAPSPTTTIRSDSASSTTEKTNIILTPTKKTTSDNSTTTVETSSNSIRTTKETASDNTSLTTETTSYTTTLKTEITSHTASPIRNTSDTTSSTIEITTFTLTPTTETSDILTSTTESTSATNILATKSTSNTSVPTTETTIVTANPTSKTQSDIITLTTKTTSYTTILATEKTSNTTTTTTEKTNDTSTLTSETTSDTTTSTTETLSDTTTLSTKTTSVVIIPTTETTKNTTTPSIETTTDTLPQGGPGNNVIPVEPIIVAGAVFQIHFIFMFSGDVFSSTNFNESLKRQMNKYIFCGFEDVIDDIHVRISITNAKSRRKRNIHLRTDGTNTVENWTLEPKVNTSARIDIDISVAKLRSKQQSLRELEQAIKENIKSNLTQLNTTAGQVLNETEPEEIIQSLHKQIEGKTECDAISTGRLCFPGYDCRALNYSAECVHKCTTSGLSCRNNGHCYFDTLVQQTVCRCQKSLMTIYYGPKCEEKTGRFEYVVGLSVGIVGGLILIVLLTVCCRRISKPRKTDREKYGECDADFIKNEFELNELNSQISMEESKDLYRYSGGLSVRNKMYEQFGSQRKYIFESPMYVPRKTLSRPPSPYLSDPVVLGKIDSFKDYTIKRPKVFSEPVNDLDSPYCRPQTHQRPYSQIAASGESYMVRNVP